LDTSKPVAFHCVILPWGSLNLLGVIAVAIAGTAMAERV